MYASFLLEDTKNCLTTKEREFLRVIKNQGRFMLNLINDLLDVTRIETGQLELKVQPGDWGEFVRRNAVLNGALATRLGVAVFLVSLALRWKAQRDLGGQWSFTLEIAPGHHLVTRGVYAHLRHPIYASLLLWAAGQPLLLHNWLAGWSGAVAVVLVWLIRVPREEALMLDAFGEEYERYRARTGRFIPRCKPGKPAQSSARATPGRWAL
jgi:hypothetical protein